MKSKSPDLSFANVCMCAPSGVHWCVCVCRSINQYQTPTQTPGHAPPTCQHGCHISAEFRAHVRARWVYLLRELAASSVLQERDTYMLSEGRRMRVYANVCTRASSYKHIQFTRARAPASNAWKHRRALVRLCELVYLFISNA